MIYLGIDWGTQSSKIYSYSLNGGPKLGRILESALYYSADHGVIGFSEDFKNSFERDHQGVELTRCFPIKRQMIQNPNYPLWEGNWDNMNLTIGAAAVLSLLGLLREAFMDVGPNNITKIHEICFSFPNWSPEIDLSHTQALKKFRSAARVAVLMALDKAYDHILPQKGVKNDEFISAVAPLVTGWQPTDLEVSAVTQVSDEVAEGVHITYLPESIAAGIPYLVRLQRNIKHAYRLLVLDIGAGSTDIGYLAQNRLGREDPFHIVYFKPAPAIGIAGEAITEAVRKQFNLKNSLTGEAKKIELSNLGRLHVDVPYVREEWIPTIAQRAQEYVGSLPHHVLMDRPEPVNIVITGGSGAVSGLANEVKTCVASGLKSNPFKGTSFPPESVTANLADIAIFNGVDAFETGRRAVSIGAGHPGKSSISFA